MEDLEIKRKKDKKFLTFQGRDLNRIIEQFAEICVLKDVNPRKILRPI
jgi:hypothetical protein